MAARRTEPESRACHRPPGRLAAVEAIDHLGLDVSDLERNLEFYRGLLAPLGYVRESTIVGERGERVVHLGLARW